MENNTNLLEDGLGAITDMRHNLNRLVGFVRYYLDDTKDIDADDPMVIDLRSRLSQFVDSSTIVYHTLLSPIIDEMKEELLKRQGGNDD